ncbi:uncharacterized protein F4812DRAFT_83374 [Daldinia caldariorum]|uniref:uncharacterized protein n=1 Tax=Daldinia caldariorum TaxID=326644 RepID=UPI002008A9EA|nr:uncharacterized protein F4812DRAFT_83374 [Daldinia caldariorum]KAI1466553.1 hypothetical protein F4812DRAFT_83374 [Daldinia caldariorum]
MQPSPTLICRLLALRVSKFPPTTRRFTRNTNLASRGRPQIPFLSVPLARNHQFRYLTTERKRWLAYEVFLGVKYTLYIWAIAGFSIAGYWAIQQEWLERKYPSPHDWGFITRLQFRLAKWAPDRSDLPEPDWVLTGNYAKSVVERLEDEKTEGAGLRKTEDGGAYAYDVTSKSEPWRRGYYEALMLCAKTAEHLDDQVVDNTRHLVFPADQVIGPSNPNPKPISPGSPSAPREQDCDRAFETPDTFYKKILATRGLTPKQKLDAALEYASWLDFKGLHDAAEQTYERALELATGTEPPPYDPKSFVLQDLSRAPSANILNTLTALATHKARTGDISAALPILISVLRARRSLPRPESSQRKHTYVDLDDDVPTSSPWSPSNIAGAASRLLSPPAYPPPPDDGTSPPVRDAKELCEEAGLNLYIGEIIFATTTSSTSSSSGSNKSREDGLAWTREAVDLAEEQLHKLTHTGDVRGDAKKTCKECLVTGLENWQAMVSRLAREEREREASLKNNNNSNNKNGELATKASGGGWLAGLWGDGNAEAAAAAAAGGRWTAEENVVKERTKRVQDLLEEADAPKAGFGSLFWA